MDSTYRPQSPDLSSYAPQSPDLSGLRPHTPDLSGALPGPVYHQYSGGLHHSHSRGHHGGSRGNGNSFGFAGSPTSVPQPTVSYDQQHQLQQQQQFNLAQQPFKSEPEFIYSQHAAIPQQQQQPQQQLYGMPANYMTSNHQFDSSFTASPQNIRHPQMQQQQKMPQQPPPDPTLGVQLRTSFPVARIKRIMQADDEIGKVAQVTPHVVSRALELFMIKLITASALQAGAGAGGANGPGGGGKSQKRILAQHMKQVITTDETFDFLIDIAKKVPDAPAKGKKEAGSDSEEGPSAAGSKPTRRRTKKRKDDDDDF